MKMLRAQEQIDGVGPRQPLVPIPMLGLPRRVEVTGSGDEEYNGIYFCTGGNGNGFFFTKPRSLTGRARSSNAPPFNVQQFLEIDVMEEVEEEAHPIGVGASDASLNLQCVISKRFSNETILWYMSKEVVDSTSTNRRNISQNFSFWAKLLVTDDAPPDVCQYPSQTHLLLRNGEVAWQSLTNTVGVTPPIVQLLDD